MTKTTNNANELLNADCGRFATQRNRFRQIFVLCEFLLSKKLKTICYKNGKEFFPMKSSKIFHALGTIYRLRSPDKFSLIKSAILFNSALSRNPVNEKEITKDLDELCQHVLNLSGVKSGTERLTYKANHLKKAIHAFRNFVKHQLKNIPICQTSDVSMQKDHSNKTAAVENLQENIFVWYCNLMKSVMDYCITITGHPPCKYALVGMGSLARKETTPYSDFEHIILLEEGVQTRDNYNSILEYFRWVSTIFHIVVVNLGETIVPCAALPYLKRTDDKDYDWFYDAFTKRGVCFDGMFPHASKFPLGSVDSPGRTNKTELIKPISAISFWKCQVCNKMSSSRCVNLYMFRFRRPAH